MTELIKIYCQNCKEYILDLDYEKLSLPFKGWMFSYPKHVEWDTAFEPEATGNDLVCPLCESMFHDEPRLLCEIHIEGREPYLGWMFVKVIPTKPVADSTEESYMIPDLGAKPEKKPNEPKSQIQETKPYGKKRKAGKRRKRRKPAIKPKPKAKSRSGNHSDQGADDKRSDGQAGHLAQFEKLASGGTNIDEFPGFSD